MAKFIDLTDHKYNRLTVKKLHHSTTKHKYWECLCECGNSTIVEGSKLRSGHTKSCGCYKTETANLHSLTHGMARTKEHQAWNAIKGRCFNKRNGSYKDYGGRGITMHKEWINSFQAFYDHIGPCPGSDYSVDRINVNGNYEPGNVRWATPIVQANNTRRNHLLTFNGETKNISEWARALNIPSYILRLRLTSYGWSVEDALTRPVNDLLRQVTLDGETMTLTELAEKFNVSRKLLYKRIFVLKWPIERAINEPAFVGKNQAFKAA